MGKRTVAANPRAAENLLLKEEKERRAVEHELDRKRHELWAAQKESALGMLVAYSRGCHAYAPWPAVPVDPGKFNYAKIARLVLVPPFCHEEVVLPAGSCQVVAGKDRGSNRIVFLLRGEPNKDGVADAFYVDVDVGLEIVMPGGKIAKLIRDGNGEWDIEESLET